MKRYLLLGLGKSNISVADDLLLNHIEFDIFLDNPESIPAKYTKNGVLIFHSIEEINFKNYSLIIKSPGISFKHKLITAGLSQNIKTTNEIGYSLKYAKKPIIAITGTNGKTTTTSQIEHILNLRENRAKAVGNIGRSFTEEAKKETHILVTELSSFQLRDLNNFKPDVSILLNIQPAHLDYHLTFEDYLRSKKKVFSNLCSTNLLIYNEDDKNVKLLANEKETNKKSFSLLNKNADAFFDGNDIFINGKPFIRKDEIGIKGIHNIQNTMASILATLQFSEQEDILIGVKSFYGVEHRLEKVIESNILKIYNDSKSTNLTAVKAALSAFDKPVTLMMGGLDRGNTFDELLPEIHKVQTLISFGESGKKIYDSTYPHTESIYEENIERAIDIAAKKISSGGILLFSPGCASWDQFSNFEERGRFFKNKILEKFQ